MCFICIDPLGRFDFCSDQNTNVIELYNLISKGSDDQQTWYNSGIGTYSKSKLLRYIPDLIHCADLAFAWYVDVGLVSRVRPQKFFLVVQEF